jgi:signal transduction histidine kinase
MLRRIFEPFFTTKPDGIGMGLAISADIIRSHGGRIWAEPGASAGLTVRCLLPRKA